MSVAGSSIYGNSINIGDQITLLGTVTAVSGKGATASVTVLTLSSDTVVVLAKDCYAPQTDGAAIGKGGKGFGVGAQVTIPGDVTGVSGTGKTAQVTMTTHSSQTSVVHSAGTAHVPKKN